jgi:hypothetical protein
MDILLLDRMQFVPERERNRDNQTDEKADQKEPAIGREHDEQNRDNNPRDQEACGSLQTESRPATGLRLHERILLRFKCRAEAEPVSQVKGMSISTIAASTSIYRDCEVSRASVINIATVTKSKITCSVFGLMPLRSGKKA